MLNQNWAGFLVGIEPKDTAKPKIRRRTLGIFPKAVLVLRVLAYAWNTLGLVGGEFSIELGQRLTVQVSFYLSHKGQKGQHHHPFSQFSCLVMSDSLRPLGLQHTRLPCPSLSLSEIAQTHVYRVRDAIQPSHALLSPSPPAFNLSQHQDQFFASGGQSTELQLQHQSLQWILRTDFL